MGTRKHRAIYGNIILKREYCRSCKGYGFVKNGILTCCDKPINESYKVTGTKVMACAVRRRRSPNEKEGKKILESQNYVCLYCNLPFGEPLWYRGKIIYLKLNWDHIEPFAYSYNNQTLNFAAACHVCNRIKHSKIFDSIEDIQFYVKYHRKRKGYRTLEDVESLSIQEMPEKI